MTEHRETAISVSGVSKTYSSGAVATRALDNVSMEAKRGEVAFLVGPSGSGKTTLLSIMGCLLRPDSGRVTIAGHDISGWSEKQLPHVRLTQIGFVFQAFNLFPNLTAGENLELALDIKGMRGSKAKERAHELLDTVGLGSNYRSFPADLSGGQKQRVAIARALAADPALLLADEPTASLDSSNGAMVIQLLRDLAHARNRAVVVVTHDSRIMQYADRIVRIEDGRIVQHGDASAHNATVDARYAGTVFHQDKVI
jgi:putative ABC transport system ATP-binding protein